MAILKRIPNKKGDGAGRSRYVLQKAVAVRTDIPSPLSLLIYSNLTDTLKKELADEYNRHLLQHQGSSKTSHYIISFGHTLSSKEIEQVLDKAQQIFDDPDRYHLYAVHQEPHGTAIHIVESANREGQLRRLSPRQFHDLKRQVIEELSPYMTPRELKTAENYHNQKATQDWKQGIEIHAPQRSWKEYIRRSVLQAAKLLEQGDVDKAVELLDKKNIKIYECRAGELSPRGKLLKRDRTYAVLGNDPNKSIRLDKKMKATFQIYQNLIQENSLELKRIKETIRGVISTIKELETPERRSREKNRALGESGRRTAREKTVHPTELKTPIPTKEETGRRDKEPQSRESITFESPGKHQEPAKPGKIPLRQYKEKAETTAGIRTKHQPEEAGAPETTRRTEQTVQKSILDNRDLPNNQLSGELLPIHPTPKNRPAHSNNTAPKKPEEPAITKTETKEPPAPENNLKPPRDHRPTQRRKLTTPKKPHIPQKEKLLSPGEPHAAAEPNKPLHGKRDNRQSSQALEPKNSRGQREPILHPNSRKLPDIPREGEQLADNHRPLQDMHSPPKQRKWIINGEEVTEEDIRDNPAIYVRCDIEEVRKLALDYLLEETDREIEFLKKEGYFDIDDFYIIPDFEETEEEVEEIKKEEEKDKGLDFGP
jgi:hypothetical protein